MPKEVSTTDDHAELAALAARPRRVEVYTFAQDSDEPVKKTVRVAPMTFRVCADCADIVKPLVEVLPPTITLEDLPMLMSDHRVAVRDLVAVATGETAEYIDELPLDQFGILATAVFEVNRDFFARRVGPTFKSLAENLFGGAGPTLSIASPNTGT